MTEALNPYRAPCAAVHGDCGIERILEERLPLVRRRARRAQAALVAAAIVSTGYWGWSISVATGVLTEADAFLLSGLLASVDALGILIAMTAFVAWLIGVVHFAAAASNSMRASSIGLAVMCLLPGANLVVPFVLLRHAAAQLRSVLGVEVRQSTRSLVGLIFLWCVAWGLFFSAHICDDAAGMKSILALSSHGLGILAMVSAARFIGESTPRITNGVR